MIPEQVRKTLSEGLSHQIKTSLKALQLDDLLQATQIRVVDEKDSQSEPSMILDLPGALTGSISHGLILQHGPYTLDCFLVATSSALVPERTGYRWVYELGQTGYRESKRHQPEEVDFDSILITPDQSAALGRFFGLVIQGGLDHLLYLGYQGEER